MNNVTITLGQVFYFKQNYDAWWSDVITNFLGSAPASTFKADLKRFIFDKIWRQFVKSNTNYGFAEQDIDDFLADFENTILDTYNEFYLYAKNNIEAITDFNGTHNTPFSKRILSHIEPINANVNQTVDTTQIGSGTTGQSLEEVTANGVAWNKIFEGYFTKAKTNELIDKFRWLFVGIYHPYYDVEATPSATINVTTTGSGSSAYCSYYTVDGKQTKTIPLNSLEKVECSDTLGELLIYGVPATLDNMVITIGNYSYTMNVAEEVKIYFRDDIDIDITYTY